VKLFAFRLKFFLHKIEVFDACVVFISLVLDIASIVDEEGIEASQALFVLRLWRIVRVVNGIFICSQSHREVAVAKERNERRKAIHILHKTQKCLQEELEEKEAMVRLMKSHSLEYVPTKKSIPLKQGASPVNIVISGPDSKY
jgi:hypothetical protein